MFKGKPFTNRHIAGFYPERKIPRESWLDRMGIKLFGHVMQQLVDRTNRYEKFSADVSQCGKKLTDVNDEELAEVTKSLRFKLRRHGFYNSQLSAESFALVREMATRKISMRPYDVQIIGGYIILNGIISEMKTGEGKTLVATLPAATVALAGVPVHIITVNDYLAKRDADLMRPIYEALGLTVGVIQGGMNPVERQQAYRCDITYCTNNEVAFDFLKDRIVMGRNISRTRMQLERLYGRKTIFNQLILRGLHFAIIDEADSVLIDEARTPLIISGTDNTETEKALYEEAFSLSEQLNEKQDFIIELQERTIELTAKGKQVLHELSAGLSGFWKGKRRREQFVTQALMARLMFNRDQHYLVKEDKIQIIDEFTGRIMGDRTWEQGLHQMIEVKEGCTLTGQRETLARISYQQFFRKYLYLSGMTGTAREVASELWTVYGLSTVRVPTNAPVRRHDLGVQIHQTAEDKWLAIVKRIAQLREDNRPVLVGIRTVEASEHLSHMLREHGLEHDVLNAHQDKEEALIIAEAGKQGKITVATNMAGRGTDIKLADGVAEQGGLHVILTELHESKRIDRQLIGRCARQGDLGSNEAILSLEDEMAGIFANKLIYNIANQALQFNVKKAQLLAKICMRAGQISAERKHSQIRRELMRADEKKELALAFSGRY